VAGVEGQEVELPDVRSQDAPVQRGLVVDQVDVKRADLQSTPM
jgi:hypothetical protein